MRALLSPLHFNKHKDHLTTATMLCLYEVYFCLTDCYERRDMFIPVESCTFSLVLTSVYPLENTCYLHVQSI